MNESTDSGERRLSEYVLFFLAGFGGLVAAAGTVVSSPGFALFGACLLLLPVLVFDCSNSAEYG
jgi:hypothetical protein